MAHVNLTPEKYVLLIFNNYGSHIRIEIIDYPHRQIILYAVIASSVFVGL